MLRILEAHEMAGILALFLIVQFGGLAIAYATIAGGNSQLIVERLVSSQSVYFAYAIDIVLAGIILMLLLNRHKRHHGDLWDHKFFAVFEAAVLVATSFFAFLFIFTSLLPQELQGWYFAISLVAALALVALRERRRSAKNLATIVSSIGVGLVLGLYFGFAYSMVILAIVAFYDYASVFITKSMIKLANKLTEEDVAFLISEEDVEAIPQEEVDLEELKQYLNDMSSRFDYKDPLYREAISKGSLPVVSQIQLGEGDLGLPLMAGVSMLFSFYSPFSSELLVAFAALGLIFTMMTLKRYRRPLPAIPPLFSFISMASGIGLLAVGKIGAGEAAGFVCLGVVVLLLGTVLAVMKPKPQKR